jgi:hypothetical protein
MGADVLQTLEVSMRIIGARASDWRAGRPDVRPGVWIGAIFVALTFYVVVAGLVGWLIVGNGAPYLS